MNAKLPVGLGLVFATLWIFGCTPSGAPETRPVDGAEIGRAVNALTKAGAVQAGYSVAREAADPGIMDSVGGEDAFDHFSSRELQDQLRAIGICENFVQLIGELSSDANQATPRFLKVVQCLENEALDKKFENATVEQVYPILDKCFCDGSGAVFGAIFAYSWQGYRTPSLNGYRTPSAGSYKSPSVSGYKSPSLPGYKAPSVP